MADGPAAPARSRTDFLRDIIDDHLARGVHARVATRFPPEPNGYLHIGHAKSICLNFGLARDYAARGVPTSCNLRFDDTNPTKEDVEYVESIEADVRWLGFAPTGIYFASDMFGEMYRLAEGLVERGLAYVCDLTDEQIRDYRGSLTEPGRPSPFRDRSPAENLDLLRRMKAGEFPDGARVLRAKIDMAASNMKLRDPLLYRIRHAHHHRTGDAWCIYPMYDYAHPLEDAFEGITHSICTLEFENNRDLYDWVRDQTGAVPLPRFSPQLSDAARAYPGPVQYEFARLALEYTVMSKRKLLTLVEGQHVDGWDDPRMPTIAGMRRRGIRPEALRAFCDLIGIAKHNSMVDIGKFDVCVRDDLGEVAPRALAVLRPVPLTISNWAELGLAPGATIDAPWFPAGHAGAASAGSRPVAIDAALLVERDDVWAEPGDAPASFQRLAVGRTVRLRHAFAVTCTAVSRDASGAVTGVTATAHAETLGGGNLTSGAKPSGVIHWVSAARSAAATVRVYDRLFAVPRPEEGGGDFLAHLSPTSLVLEPDARVEAAVASAAPGARFQFERVGYFIADEKLHAASAPVFNRIIALRDAQAVAAPAPSIDAAPKKNAKAATRPKSKSPAEYRAEARERNPDLKAAFVDAQARGLSAADADLVSGDDATARLFTRTVAQGADPALTAKWIINELPRALDGRDLDLERDAGFIEAFATLIQAIAGKQLPGPAAKAVLAAMIAAPGTTPAEHPTLLAAAEAPADLGPAIDAVLAANADKVAAYRSGKVGLLGFFVGNVVKAVPGADPAEVKAAVTARLT